MKNRFLILVLILFTIVIDVRADSLSTLKVSSKHLLKYALKGKVENIIITIGSPESLIVKTYGKPIDIGWLSGGYGYYYKDFSIFTDSVTVTSIHVWGKGAVIGGFKIGTKLSTIKLTLGKPTYYGFISSNEGEEIFPNKWLLEYNLGKYILFYAADKNDGPCVSGELRKNFDAH